MTDEDELLDALRAANPYAAAGDLPPTTTGRDARFEEITMHTPTATPETRSGADGQRRFWQNPRIAAPAALAVAALVAVGALIAGTATAPSALALVTEAAQQSATHDSGRLHLAVDLTDVPSDLTDFTHMSMVHRFDGADFENALTFEGPGFFETITTIRIGGTDLVQYNDSDRFVSDWEESDIDDFGLNLDTFGPDAALPILEQAEDYALDRSDDGVDVYTATVPTSIVLAIPEAELPPGLTLLSGEDNEEAMLPEALAIAVAIEDGQLIRMVVDVVAESDEQIDATITTTFSELGEAQAIVAPNRG